MLTVGIDVGGTTVKSALVKVGEKRDPKRYRVVKTAVVKTDASGGKASVLDSITSAFQKVTKEGVRLVGVGSAGDVDPDTGVIKFATDALPGFTGLDLYSELSKRFRLPTVVLNDASAATVGECFFGAGRGCSRVLVLTLGTGLGCSLYQASKDGSLTSQTVVNYREVGHSVLHPDGRTCLCGKKGCAEQYVSATALKKNAKEEGYDENLKILFDSYRRGETAAMRAVVRFFRDFTEVLKSAAAKYRPEIIVVGGGVTEAEGWWEDFIAYSEKEVSVPVKRAELKNKAGFLGAVFNALNGKYTHQKGVDL